MNDRETEPLTSEEGDEPEAPTGPVTIQLASPIPQKGREPLTEIVIRELTARHVWNMPLTGQTFGDLFELAGKASGIPKTTIEKLGPEDTGSVLAVVAGFIGRFQGITG